MILVLFASIAVVMAFLLVRNVLVLAFSLQNYKVHKKRLRQLGNSNGKEELEIAGVVDRVTKPVVEIVFRRFKPKNLDELDRLLKMARWNKTMSALQFRALDLIFKVLAIVAVSLFWSKSVPLAIFWFVALFFGLNFFLKNSWNTRKDKLIEDFPDFITVTEGYLSAGVPFSEAVTKTIKYVGPEWQEILRRLVVNIETFGTKKALDALKNDVDLFEVREFVALVRLTLEQGGDMAESFRSQAERVEELQMLVMYKKISQRQAITVFIQIPIMILDLAVFGAPVFMSIADVMGGTL